MELHQAFENFRKAFMELVRAVFDKLMEGIRALVNYVKEVYERQEKDPAPFYKDHWVHISQKHQQHSRIQMKAQEKKMRSWSQPWKAWKAQRR
jgi:hypothetical protein